MSVQRVSTRCCLLFLPSLLQIWFPPFRRLSKKEVSYLVKGIADVYGRDEEEVLQERQQLLLAHGSDDGFGSMKDARLGLGVSAVAGAAHTVMTQDDLCKSS